MSIARSLFRPALLALVLGLVSCDSPSGPKPAGSPAHVDIVSGNAQTAVAGAGLGSPLVVKVTDAKGKPVVGQAVQYQVLSGGGSLSSNSATTGSDGEAQVTWTLGTVARDTQKVEARVLDSSGGVLASAVFKAVALPDVPAALTKVSGDAQTGAVGTTLADSLAVKLADRFGNAISGQTITFAVTSGDGSVSPTTRATDSTGIAKTQWKLGARLDVPQGASASFGSLAPATFAATATVAGGLTKVGGDAQTGTVRHFLADSLAVQLKAADGTPVRGATIQWTTVGGSLVPTTKVTDANGIARTAWLLGSAVGGQTATATVMGGSQTVSFTATANADPADHLEVVSGDRQTGAAGSTLASPLVVRAVDGLGNPIAGAVVTWTAGIGGSVSPTSTVTGADGLASASWTLGTHVGDAQTAVAHLGASTGTFNATMTPAAPAATAVYAGSGQTGSPGTVLRDSIGARVVDAYGNGIAGQPVTWTVTAGGGSVSPATGTTGANGIAWTHWTIGPAAGANQLTATSGSLSGAVFTATGTSLSVRFISPADSAVVAGNLPVSVGIRSPYRITSAVATVQDRTATLTFASATAQEQTWSGTVNTAGLPTYGTFRVSVTVTDSVGNTATISEPFRRNVGPKVVLDAPLQFAVARPQLHVAAHCVDDNPAGCTGLTVFANDAYLAGGPGQSVDQIVSLAGYEGQTVTLVVRGYDSDGYNTDFVTRVYVESSTHLTPVVSVNGLMLDADAGHVVYVDSAAQTVRVLDRQTGADTAVFALSFQVRPDGGRVTPTGALFVTTNPSGDTRNLYEWYNGTLINRGATGRLDPTVGGNLGAWEGTGGIVLRDFAANTTTTVPGHMPYLGENGDLVYVLGNSAVLRRRGAATDTIAAAANEYFYFPKTDGTNVVYVHSVSDPSCLCGTDIKLYRPTGTVLLSSNTVQYSNGTHYVQNGWAAYLHAANVPYPWTGLTGEVWTIDPSNNRQLVDNSSTALSGLVALGANGEVVGLADTRYRLTAPPYTSPVDIAHNFRTNRFFTRGGTIYMLLGSTMFQVQ